MRVKLIAFVAAALMAMALVVPALAANNTASNTVNVQGNVTGQTTLKIALSSGTSIGFTSDLAVGTCSDSSNQATFTVTTNASYSTVAGTVGATTSDAFNVGHLYWKAGSQGDCTGTAFTSGGNWITAGTPLTGKSYSETDYYAAQPDITDAAGSFTVVLTYSVTVS